MKTINLFEEFFKFIRVRVLFKNKNWLAIITGDTGSGKSYSALSMARKISNSIHIVFTPLEFMELLNSDKVSKGSVIIFDEAGVGLSSREWYSQQNKLLGSILQTFRNMNLAVIFTTPDLSFIDVQARKLFHSYFETFSIDYENNISILKPFIITSDGRTGKVYYRFPIIYKGGREYVIKRLGFRKPDARTIEYYEGLKSVYTRKLNSDALAELRGDKVKVDLVEERSRRKKEEVEKIKEKILKNKDDYLKVYYDRKFISVPAIMSDFGLSMERAKLVKAGVEKDLGI